MAGQTPLSLLPRWTRRALGRVFGGALLGAAFVGSSLVVPETAEARQFLSLYHRPDLKWYTIETEHFMVHYPVSRKGPDKAKHYTNGEWAARKVAKVSEDYYGPMCAEFDYYLEEKVHIVVLEQYDQLQGFTIPARNWVEISGNPGGSFYRLRGRSEWFSNVLVHEFAHVVSLKKNQASGENLVGSALSALYVNDALGANGADADLGAGASVFITDRGEPWWWTEGGAEFWSSRSGYNWWTSARDRHIRNTILEDRALTYDQWKSNQAQLDWGDGERGYQQGHSIALYMRQRFGAEAFAAFAKEHDKAWRGHWEAIIEEQTGVEPRQLYHDWKAWVEDYYQRTYADLIAEGEVKGVELSTRPVEFAFHDPAARDKFYTDSKKKKLRKRRSWETAKDRTGRYDIYPKMSDDGKWFVEGYSYGRMTIGQLPERVLPPSSGGSADRAANADAFDRAARMRHIIPAAFSSNYDFVPGQDQIVLSMQEDQMHSARLGYHAIRFERDGYNWNKLAIVDLKTRTETKKHGEREIEVEYLAPKGTKGRTSGDTWRAKGGHPFREIPNTERGTDPAVSPDGTRVAYIEYGDGTHNLVTIDLDGGNKTYMTEFESGEMIQSVDWSPDGTQLVFALFKNYQGDLWLMDVATKQATAINQDSTEELDVHWSKHDGNLYFSSDETGIYNLYRYEVDTRKIQQLTNVITTAYTPFLTPRGDLMYSNVTAFGHKNYILAKEEFLEKDATDQFGLTYDEVRAKANWEYTEDLSEFESMTTRYNSLARFHPPALVPIIRLRNPALKTFTLDTGMQVGSFDYGEKHGVTAVGIVGANAILFGNYTYNGWHAELSVGAQHVQVKSDFGFRLDADGDPNTTDDQSVYESKNNQYSNALFFNTNYPLNSRLRINGSAVLSEFGFRGVADKTFRPFNRSVSGTLGMEFSTLFSGVNIGRVAFGVYGINATGRYVTVNYTHGFTDHVYEPNNGVNNDDGERLDKYNYNSLRVRWTEHMPMPFSRKLRGKGHALQLELHAGAMDRNVQLFDEFRGGGAHPMNTGSGAVVPTQPLSGYPAVLLGETMAIGSAYYRFPIARQINEKAGPFVMRDIYVQAGGSAGNFWSFRPPEGEGEFYFDNQGDKVAYDRSKIRREIPFVDVARKNGNYLLTDLSAELRISSLLAGSQFNSILRVSYGLQPVTGIFDVSGDDINETTNNLQDSRVSTEIEQAGPRIYLGIGTGF